MYSLASTCSKPTLTRTPTAMTHSAPFVPRRRRGADWSHAYRSPNNPSVTPVMQPLIQIYIHGEPSMMPSAMPLILVPLMTFAQEHIFVRTVGCECYCRRAQTGKGAFEPIESGERTSSSPYLPGNGQVSICRRFRRRDNLRSSPWVVLWRAGSLHVFPNIETCHVGSWRRGHSCFFRIPVRSATISSGCARSPLKQQKLQTRLTRKELSRIRILHDEVASREGGSANTSRM